MIAKEAYCGACAYYVPYNSHSKSGECHRHCIKMFADEFCTSFEPKTTLTEGNKEEDDQC